MSRLFRQAALDKISNPDQLDRVLSVVRPMHGIGISVAVALVLGGFAWSILSTAPVPVKGQGILLSAEGVAVVSSFSEGRIERILAGPGTAVEAGQTVALLRQSASLDQLTAKRAELEGARNLLQLRQSDYDNYLRMQGDLVDTKGKAIAEQLAKLQEQLAVQYERRRNLQALLAKGFTTSSRLNEAQTQAADLENRIADLSNERIEMVVRQRSEQAQRAQEIHEAGLRVQALERELQNMERDYDRRRSLTAPVDAVVAELNADPGDMVSAGEVVMRLLPVDASGRPPALRAIVFVPNQDGKKIRPGMAAHVMPSTTKLQKDGFIRGQVLNVAHIPSSREGIMRRLKNATLVDSLLSNGAPFEVELELETDPTAPSGYRWSSGEGPDITIDVGTIAAADMVVERRRVISLAMPAFDYIFRWLGVR